MKSGKCIEVEIQSDVKIKHGDVTQILPAGTYVIVLENSLMDN